MKVYSPLSLLVASRETPVAVLINFTFTPLTTAPVESATRPMMRPPVLWPKAGRRNIKSSGTTEKQKLIRRAVGEDIVQPPKGSNQFSYLRIAPKTNLAIIR